MKTIAERINSAICAFERGRYVFQETTHEEVVLTTKASFSYEKENKEVVYKDRHTMVRIQMIDAILDGSSKESYTKDEFATVLKPYMPEDKWKELVDDYDKLFDPKNPPVKPVPEVTEAERDKAKRKAEMEALFGKEDEEEASKSNV